MPKHSLKKWPDPVSPQPQRGVISLAMAVSVITVVADWASLLWLADNYRQNEAKDPADGQTQKIRVRDFFAKLTD
jgi:hypothetical protein